MRLVVVEMLRHCVVWPVELSTRGEMVIMASLAEGEMKVCVCVCVCMYGYMSFKIPEL